MRGSRRAGRRASLVAALLACGCAHAPARSQEAADPVLDPLNGPLDPQAFFIDLDRAGTQAARRPVDLGIAASAALDSDLFPSRPGDTVGLGFEIDPEVSVVRDGPRLRFSGTARGAVRIFPGHATENLYALTTRAAAQWLATRDLTLSGSLEAAHLQEDRVAAFASSDARRPVRYERFAGTAGARYAPGGLVVAPFVSVERLAFHDERSALNPSLILDQSRRSLVHVTPGLIAGYRLRPGVLVYAGGELDSRDYDEVMARNSHGFVAYGGVRLNPSRLLRVSAEVGYQKQRYRTPLSDPAGVLVRLRAQYVPDPLTSLRATFRTDVSETGALELGGARREVLELAGERTFTRTIAASAGLTAYRAETRNGTARETRISADLQARYRLSRSTELFVRAEPTLGRSSGILLPTRSFDRTLVQAGIRMHPF